VYLKSLILEEIQCRDAAAARSFAGAPACTGLVINDRITDFFILQPDDNNHCETTLRPTVVGNCGS